MLAAVRWLTATEPAQFTTAVWPVGAGISYAGRAEKIRRLMIDLEPVMIPRMWGEETVAIACQCVRPSAIMIVQFDMTDAGGKYFGKDYGVDFCSGLKPTTTASRRLGRSG